MQKAEADAKMVALKHEVVDLSCVYAGKDRAEQAVDDAEQQVVSLCRAIGEQGESTEEGRQELAAALEELNKKQSKLSQADADLSKCNDDAYSSIRDRELGVRNERTENAKECSGV